MQDLARSTCPRLGRRAVTPCRPSMPTEQESAADENIRGRSRFPASRHRKQDVPLRGAPSDADESVHPCSVRCFIGERARSGSPAENHGSSRVVNTTPGSIPRSARRVNLVHVRHAAAGAFGRRRARSRRSACVRRRNRRTGEFSPNCELSDASSPLGSPNEEAFST